MPAKAARESDKPAQPRMTTDAVGYGTFQRLLSIVAGQVDLAVDRVFHEKFDLNNTEWQVLAALRAGPMSFIQVVEICAMDKARVSRAQKRLLDRGFMRSVPDATDGRKVIQNLTPKGASLIEEMAPEIGRIESWVLNDLAEDERKLLQQALGKLADRCLGRARPASKPMKRRPPSDI